MKKLIITFLWAALPFFAVPQDNPFVLLEYKPAPGQHMNVANIGTPQAAEAMTGETDKLVSLGSFGGYITLKFDRGCANDPANPYGIDFTVFGNAFSGASEPGVVWVMKDENQNGLADDTWFEIAGSRYFHSGTRKKYQVTYFKTGTRDVFWEDNEGGAGWLLANSFNLQEYYPLGTHFPEYPSDSVSFQGTLLVPRIDSTNQQEIRIAPFAFGYADNFPRVRSMDPELPDNPYSLEVEGAGGDPIDISWAVNDSGNYVDLDSIHFVRIVSGALQATGRLGEVSTDVAWLADVGPGDELNEKRDLLVPDRDSARLIAGDSLRLEALFFSSGKKQDVPVTFSSRNESVVVVNPEGMVEALQRGETEVDISAGGESRQVLLRVVEPASIEVSLSHTSIYPGDSAEVTVAVPDHEGQETGLPVVFTSSNPAVGEVIQAAGKTWLKGLQPGDTDLICRLEEFSLEVTVPVRVLSEEDKIKIYFSMKREGENLFPLQWIEVGEADRTGLPADLQETSSGLNRLTLLDALLSGLKKAGVPFEFRKDEAASGKLYLYWVEKDGIYTYGWGGKVDPGDFARGWIARHNQHHFLNSFNEVEISDGDTVDLYHVVDLTTSWSYRRLLSSQDSARSGDELSLWVEEASCSLSDGEILEGVFEPVASQEVLATESYFTNENGRFSVMLEQDPPVVFHSGELAIFIARKLTTHLEVLKHDMKVFPNPASDWIRISGEGLADGRLSIRDTNGRIHMEKYAGTSVVLFDVQGLAPGIYHIVQESDEQTGSFKFIKK